MTTAEVKTKKKKKKKNRDADAGNSVPRVAGKSLVVHVSELRRNPWNYNVLDEVGMEKLKATITQDGFAVDIVVRELDEPKGKAKYEIVDGEHRWIAAKELGMKKVPIRNLGKVTDQRAKGMTIKLNELKGKPDSERLALIVDELMKSNDAALISTLPFDDEELADLTALARERLEQTPPPSAGGTGEDGDEDGKTRTKKVKDKYDVHMILKLAHMSDDEEEEFISLLHQVEDVMGINKRPFRLLMQLMREKVHASKAGDRIKNRRKKGKKKTK